MEVKPVHEELEGEAIVLLKVEDICRALSKAYPCVGVASSRKVLRIFTYQRLMYLQSTGSSAAAHFNVEKFGGFVARMLVSARRKRLLKCQLTISR